jgi:hypothetical protein
MEKALRKAIIKQMAATNKKLNIEEALEEERLKKEREDYAKFKLSSPMSRASNNNSAAS